MSEAFCLTVTKPPSHPCAQIDVLWSRLVLGSARVLGSRCLKDLPGCFQPTLLPSLLPKAQQVPTCSAGTSVRADCVALLDWVSAHALLSRTLPLMLMFGPLTAHVCSLGQGALVQWGPHLGREWQSTVRPKGAARIPKLYWNLLDPESPFPPISLWEAETECSSQLCQVWISSQGKTVGSLMFTKCHQALC